MILSNLRGHAAFIAMLLVFCCFIIPSAVAETNQLPEKLHDVLQGTTVDLPSVAAELKDTNLPAALAIIELLKFKVLHQETAITSEQINQFELLIKTRLASSAVVSFSKTETCRSKVNSHEIQIAGQKIIVPEYYVADIDLIITGVIPAGEAGTVFPDIQINFISRSPITEYSLNIDGNNVPNCKISVFDDDNELGLIFRPDLNTESILSIGTHTAEIIISNEKGEQTKKQWTFTVGIYDTSEPPVPEGATIVKELPISPDRILPGSKAAGEIFITVYQDKNGRRYTSYKLAAPSGMTIESSNLAFIARRIKSGNNSRDNLVILPNLTHAFPGHPVTFSYEWSGPGTVTGEEWEINGVVVSSLSAIINSNTRVRCRITVEIPIESGGTYNATVSANRLIQLLSVTTYIDSYRQFHISSEKPYRFELEGKTQFIPYGFKLTEGTEIVLNEANTGIAEASGLLKVNRLRWKIIASEGFPEIEKPSLLTTGIVFLNHGFAEVAFEIELTYSENGQTQNYALEPQTSALYAFYKADAKAKLEKVYPGQLVNTRRPMNIETFEFKINNQSRTLLQESDCSLESPVTLCASTLWPASAPIQIKTAFPLIATVEAVAEDDDDEDEDEKNEEDEPFLERLSPFKFYTHAWAEPGPKTLWLYCYFFDFDVSTRLPKSRSGLSQVGQLVSMTVLKGEDIFALKLDPDHELTVPEDFEVKFKALLSPLPDYGNGSLSENSTLPEDLNILDGYKIVELKSIDWFEDALWIDNDDWATGGVVSYSHVFNPTKGFGKYAMRCRFDLKLEESVTKDSCRVLPEAGVSVNAVPGLRILSPIDKLAYPLNQTIKVTTTMDSEEHAGQWEKIQWKLNGKDFIPPSKKPAFPLLLNKAGKWKIEAELKTINPITGDDLILKDNAEFEVKPLEIYFDSVLKVIDHEKQKTLPLKLIVKTDDHEAQKPGQPFPWHTSGQQAIIEPVKWALSRRPNDCASADFDSQSLLTSIAYKATGAVTVLATVTVRLINAKELFKKRHKGFKDEFEDPIFTFPAVRADLWAITAGPIKNIAGRFPQTAIAAAYRTYQLASFSFDLACIDQINYAFNKDTGLQQIALDPALPGIDSIKTSNIEFKWKAESITSSIQQEQELPTRFVIKPAEPCTYNVTLEAFLNFSGSSPIQLGEAKTTAEAVSLFSMIEASVVPSSFTMTLGETKTLKYLARSLESTPPPPVITTMQAGSANKSSLYLMNKEFVLTIDKVEWTSAQQAFSTTSSKRDSIEGNPYDFIANVAGIIKGLAKGLLKVEELKSAKTADFEADVSWSCAVNSAPVQILVNGKHLGSEKYHMGQKIVLSYKAESDNLENVVWSIENPLAHKSNINTRIATHTVTNYEVATLTPEDLKKKQVEFYLYDFDPEKVVKTGSFTYQISGKKFVEGFEIPYSRPYCKLSVKST